MTRYVLRGGEWVDAETVEPLRPTLSTRNMVIRDIEPYLSPASKQVITSRRERREDFKRTGTREVDPSEFKGRMSEGFRERHGITWGRR